MFRINNIHISDFGTDEYPEFNSSPGGDSVFIHGTNNTGKSTTLDGIIYSIFGYRFIERKANPIDETEITLSDGDTVLSIERKYNQKDQLKVNELNGDLQEFSGRKEVWDELSTHLNLPADYREARLLVKALFLPQRVEDAPLRSFSGKELRSVILSFSTGVEANERINELEEAIAHHEKEIEKLGFRKNNIKNEIKDERNVIQRNKNHLENLSEFLSICRSGDISDLKELLEKKEEIKAKIDRLYSERTKTYDELIKTRRKIGDLQRYHDKEVVESAKQTLSVLTCPVCADSVDLDKVESRKRVSKCPFCGKEEYSGELFETLSERIELADDRIKELRESATDLEEKKDKLDEEIEQIKKKNSQLKNINPIVLRALDESENDDQLEDIFEEYKQEYYQLENKLEEKRDNIESKKEALDDIRTQIDEHESKKEEIKEKRDRIDEEFHQECLKQFNKILDSIYKQLIDPLDHELYYEDGDLLLDTGNAVKDCMNKHALGFSQRRLVDISLWLTFHRMNREDEITALNFALVDDIYENIDNTQIPRKDNLMDSLREFKNNMQLVTCSIDSDLNSSIGCETVEHLEYQTNLTKYSEQA